MFYRRYLPIMYTYVRIKPFEYAIHVIGWFSYMFEDKDWSQASSQK